MEILIFIFIFIAIYLISQKALKNKPKKTYQEKLVIDEGHQKKLHQVQLNDHLLKKIPILNGTEKNVFFRLQKLFKEENLSLYIQPQVALGTYVKFDGDMPGMCSRCDFIITDSSFFPICAIEVNGSGHHTNFAAKSMEIKRVILDSVEIPIYTVEVPDYYEDYALQMTLKKVTLKIKEHCK